MEWDQAMAVLAEWGGRDVIVVPFIGPGLSLRQLAGPLDLEQPAAGVVRLRFPGMAIALPRATFIEAGWITGQEDRGLSVVQGGARVDVFLDGGE
jgi:hypothetical protein